ncbi:nitrous oxide reductase family maturation protein NosD [Lutimonas sp.]|uniref:nitrous oxide reductase family maturation protein NosD n=1 Tax=Lutimonas sp. TaxID=1872403 RepID=UPI003D9B3469
MKRIRLIFTFLLLSFSLFGQQIEVCDTCEIRTIKEAIAKSKDGDEILIKKGLYKEHGILVEKAVHIRGEKGTVVDGENKETIFRFSVDGFSIRGLEIINVGRSYTKDFAAILVSKADGFIIEDNVFKHVFFGILVEKSKNGKVHKNVLSSEAVSQANSGNGIHLWHCSKMIVSDNELSGLRDGIYFEFVKNSEVFGNRSEGNLRYGLHFMFSNENAYFNNVFKDNGAGVAIMFSKFVKMYENRFEHNWGTASYGLLLKEIYDAEITDNVFDQNTIGISVDGSTRINYQNNTFSRNGWAVTIIGACYENIFSRNNFLNNALDLSYNSKINTNKFENNYWSEYSGYDLDKNGIGDIPYRPVKLFSYIVHNTPETIILLRSMFVDIINFSEKVSPVFTPDNLIDSMPLMQRI